MERLTVSALGIPSSDYPIFIGTGVLNKLSELVDLSSYSAICVVADRNVETHLKALRLGVGKELLEMVIEVDEQRKSIDTAKLLWQRFKELGLDRSSLILNLGGGVTGDLGGFAASTYMRGVDFMQLPTTLLAQVDASVGGKVGVNLAQVKNLVGSFAPPKAVIIDTNTLTTLSKRELNSGYAEAIKHGAILDRAYFDSIASGISPAAIAPLIQRSCEIKAEVVGADEREQGRRKLLNFGHTLGHAIEAIALQSNTPLLHGEAVALGMVGESWLSCELGLLNSADLLRIEEALSRYQLPIRLSGVFDDSQIQQKIAADKKSLAGIVGWTLLAGIGAGVINQTVKSELIVAAMRYLRNGE